MASRGAIKAIDRGSVHRITSGQVVIDLQTAVKELVENSLDAGATNIEVRFKQYGLNTIEVIDNGSGIAEEYHDSVALKHYTSKLATFSDLSTVLTFGFRGEALSSLCALSEMVTVITATEPPLGMSLEMEPSGKVYRRTKVARQRGTTVVVKNLFLPLPVRRKELERNAKRDFGKALALLNAYALAPCCCSGAGVRLTVSNQIDKGQKSIPLRTTGAASSRAAVASLWGPKALDNLSDLDLDFKVERDKTALKRSLGSSQTTEDTDAVPITVKGLVSKFAVGAGRNNPDRQFFYVNGRPCNLTKIQKAFNEVYRSFNVNQAPFILADFIVPTDSCDINVSPDKRTIFLHSEANLISALKASLEAVFAPVRSTYDVNSSQSQRTQSKLPGASISQGRTGLVTDENSCLGRVSTESRSDEPALEPSSSIERLLPSSPPSGHVPPVENKSINGTSSLQECSYLDEVISPGNPASISVEHDQMDADDSTSPPAVAESTTSAASHTDKTILSPTVTLDTTKTIWGRSSQQNNAESNFEDPVQEIEQEKEPPRKKRKSDYGTIVGQPGHSSPTNKDWRRSSQGVTNNKAKRTNNSTTKDARGRLRNQIIEFSRNGSQPSSNLFDPGESDEDSDEMDEDECQTPEKIDEVGREISPPESSRSAGSQRDSRPDDDCSQISAPESPLDLLGNDVEATSRRSPLKAIDLTADDEFVDLETSETSVLDLAQHTLSSQHRDTLKPPEVVRSSDLGDISLRLDMDELASRWKNARDSSLVVVDQETASRPAVPSNAGLANTEDNDGAADALSRVIDKADFAEMEVIGQFNLGFIVARRRKSVSSSGTNVQTGDQEKVPQTMDDLFIVDQHAADEKYNFETLQQTTNIQSQKLFRAQNIELVASDEMLAIENIEVLRQNGFEIEVGEDDDSRQGSRLKLTAQPISKSTVFDMKDLEEIIHLMRDRPAGQMVRCSKARSMFAMRACRKSVMVGMPLNKQQMTLVVQHMGTMDQPWNCPHGRPTMRHLLDITRTSSHGHHAKIDWSSLSRV